MTTQGISIEDGMIVARTPFHMKDACRGVPGAKWNPTVKAWVYPLTALAARTLNTRLSIVLPRSPEFMALVRDADTLAAESDRVKKADDLDDVPVTRHPAWRHQRQAFHFARRLDSAMLAMDMGTGKSKVTIDLIQNSDDRLVLIVCPKSVVAVWPREFEKHAADPSRFMVIPLSAGTTEARAQEVTRKSKLAMATGKTAVFVINYEAVWRDAIAKVLMTVDWSRIVCDESHRIKSPTGVASKFMGKLGREADRRLALTGTPMPHSPLDAFGQYRFLDPSVFGDSFFRFKHTYGVWGGYGGHELLGYRNEDDLNSRFYSLAYRVGKEVLDLPEAIHDTRSVALEPSAMKMYRDLRDEFVAWVGEGHEVTATNALAKLLRMQQLTSGFLPGVDGEGTVEVSTAKSGLLADVIEDMAVDEPVVVFCRFRADLDVVHRVAAAQGRTSAELSGRTNALASWQAGEADVLAVQIQSGGVGIDLTRARYCIYYSLGFSLGDYMQSLARVHRPGQTRSVTYLHLVATDTIDEVVYAALAARDEVVQTILRELQ